MQAKIFNRQWWLSCEDSELLTQVVAKNLATSGFQVLNFIDHQFQPQGYTCLWLLAESHAAIHSFPEQGRCYLELSSCTAALLVNFTAKLQASAKQHQWHLVLSEE